MKYYGLPLLAITIISIAIITMISLTTMKSLSPLGQVTSTRVTVYNALPANCSFTIPAGRNQLSFFCIPNGIAINDVLENITYEVIRNYDASSTDKWKIYKPSLPSWVVQDLNDLKRTEAYFLETTSSQIFLYEGSKRVPNNIQLVQGWNFVGYPTNNTQNITVALSSIAGNYEEVRSYNNTDGTYYSHTPPNSGNLYYAEPYRAYWIYMNTSDTWVVS